MTGNGSATELSVIRHGVGPSTFGTALQGRRIAVVGLGYVGLPTALSLADHGAEIIGCDISESRLAEVKSGRVDLLDRDRERLMRHLQGDQVKLTTEPSAITNAEAILVCVPTPIDAHQTPDLTALAAACGSVVENARASQTIVLTSTTYVGCTRELLVGPLQARGLLAGSDVFVAFSPERIDPCVEAHAPDTTPRVVGGVTEGCTRRAMEVLRHTASAMHIVRQPNAHQDMRQIPMMKNGSMRVRKVIWSSLIGERLASVVPTMFQTGVPL